MKSIRIFSVGCLVGMAVSVGIAQAAPEELLKSCASCHGEDGNVDDLNVPNIAGLSEVYFIDNMLAYKSGDRPGISYKPKDGEETDMGEISKDLSEADIEALAAFYAEQKYQPREQAVDAALAAKGKEVFDDACEKCHSEGGAVAEDDAGILAGQGKPYLQAQFKLYDEGSRYMPKKMASKWEELSDDDKAALIEFMAGGSK
jgi:sulfide dehydrogenase cytochrome subunit